MLFLKMIKLPESRFNSFDSHFASFICKIAKTQSTGLFLAAALVSEALRNGHVCIDIDQIESYNSQFSPSEQLQLPPSKAWKVSLEQTSVVGKPGDYRPLILDSGKLYLYRYWNYEQQLGTLLLERIVNKPVLPRKPDELTFNKLFQKETEVNWQKVAAAVSLFNTFTSISGGPGTGKTTTVAKILTLLQSFSEKTLRIALCAPTGKAAARLSKSLSSANSLDGTIPVRLPDDS